MLGAAHQHVLGCVWIPPLQVKNRSACSPGKYVVKHIDLHFSLCCFEEVQKTYTHQQQKFVGAEQRKGA